MKNFIRTFLISISTSLCLIAQLQFTFAQTATILPLAKTQFLDSNGKPVTSGTVDFYIPGSTTRKTTWQDAARSISNTNPVVLDAAGRALIYGYGTYRQIVKDRIGNLIWDQVTNSYATPNGGNATGDGLLVGSILPWSGLQAPNQYVFAYGQELSRITFPDLLTALTLSQTVNCTNGSTVLSGITDTSQTPVGAKIEVLCIAGTATVVSKTSNSYTVDLTALSTLSPTAVIYPYGNGNASTTFNVPDLRGRAIAGRDNMGNIAANRLTSTYFANPGTGAVGGSQSDTLVTANFPPYTPAGSNTAPIITITPNGALTFTSFTGASGTGAIAITAVQALGATASAPIFNGTPQGGTSTPLSIVQPTLTLNYIIKVSPDISNLVATGVMSLGGMTGAIACGDGLSCTGNIISVSGGGAGSVTSLTAGTGITLSPSPITAAGSVNLTVPVVVANGGTGATTFTSNAPLIGNGASAIAVGSRSGNTTVFATANGSLTNGHCVSIDASGNFVDAGSACSGAGGGGTVASATSGLMAIYTGSSPSTTVGGLATANNGVLVTSNSGVPSIGTTIPTGVTWGGNIIPSAKGGTNADLSGAANKTIPVANGSGTFAASTATAWFDNVYCNTVGYIIVRTTGAWTCSQSSGANPIWWGADNTGVGDSAAAWNAMLGAGVTNIVCTPGTYLISSATITIPQQSNIYVKGPGGNGSGPDGNQGMNGSCILKQTSTSLTMFTYLRVGTQKSSNLTLDGVYLQGPITSAPVSYPVTGFGTSVGISWKGVTNGACILSRCENNKLTVSNSVIDGFSQGIYLEYSQTYITNTRFDWNGYCIKGGYDASYSTIINVTCTVNNWGISIDNGLGSGGNDGVTNGWELFDFFSCCNTNEDLTLVNVDSVHVFGGGMTGSGSGGNGSGTAGNTIASIHCKGCSNLSVIGAVFEQNTTASPRMGGIWLTGVKGYANISNNSIIIDDYAFKLEDGAGYTSNYVLIHDNFMGFYTTTAGTNTSTGVNTITNNLGYNSSIGGFLPSSQYARNVTLTSGSTFSNTGGYPASLYIKGSSISVTRGGSGVFACSATTECNVELAPNEIVSVSGAFATATVTPH